MAEDQNVYDQVSWLCWESQDGPNEPCAGVYVPRDDESGIFWLGKEPDKEEFPKHRTSVSVNASDVYDLESDAWVEYGKMHTAIAITSMREAERAMLNALGARGTEELRRMTGTETKGA